MKLNILLVATVAIATSTLTMAVEPPEKAEDKNKGIQFSSPIGPFYDPVFGGGAALLPTAVYYLGEAERESKTTATLAYTVDENWYAVLGTENYLGASNQWLIESELTLAYTETSFTNFMRPITGGSSVATLRQNSLMFDFTLGYKIFDNTYFGPFLGYRKFTQERFESDPNAISNVFPDSESYNIGLNITYDNRDNSFDATQGLYLSLQAKHAEKKKTGGNLVKCSASKIPCSDPNEVLVDLNGEASYLSIEPEIRYYRPISEKTTFAVRSKMEWNGDGASDTSVTLYDLANGFTQESSGRHGIAADFELRHWFNDKYGVMGGISVGKSIETGDRDQDALFAGLIGIRYMLMPEHRLSARLDVAYNTQEEDNFVAYFNVGQSF